MKRKSTIADIAQALNITKSTVSRALSGFPAISEKTRQAVIDAAERLNYRPNKLASALKSGRTFIVGLIVPSIESHFFASIIHSIEESLKDMGYRILLFQSKEKLENEIKGVKALLEVQVDGIISSLSLETIDTTHFNDVLQQGIPLILFDRVSKTLNVPTVTLDDFKAGYLATEHLIENGYREIAFVTTNQHSEIFLQRLEGYRSALSDYKLKIREENIIRGGLSIKDGRFGAGKLLRSPFIPDAIIAGDDFTALGIIKKLKEEDLSPPKIGVIGFANEGFSAYISPSLSTIDQHPTAIGVACAQLFLDSVQSSLQFSAIKHIVVQPDLVARQSTAKV